MDKKFTCSGTSELHTLCDAIDVGFAVAIGNGIEDSVDVRDRFDALEIGETLIDEDGDTWERIA